MLKEKTNVYLLSIVAIVAVVGVVILLLNTNIEQIPTQLSEENVVGFATSAAACTDTDGGIRSFDYLTKGTISGGTWKTTGRTYTAKTDSCAPNGKLLEGFCSDATHGFYVYKSCATVVGAGYVCDDGACVLDSDSDTVPDSLDICDGEDDTIDSDSDGTPDCAEVEEVTFDSVEICDEDLFLGETLADCQGELTDADVNNLADDVYHDSEGSNTQDVKYTQQIQFNDDGTGRFIFTQDDDDAPEAGMYFFIDNSNIYLYTYVLEFDSPIYYDDTSASTAENDLVDTELHILGMAYSITGVGYESSDGSLSGLTLEDSNGNELMIDNNIVYLNSVEVEGSYAELDSSAGTLESIMISYAPDTDEEYLVEGEELEDPIFGLFSFVFQSIENDDYETIEFVSGSKSGEIRFKAQDGRITELPLAADSSYTSGEASDEQIFWASLAPSATLANQDELVYLEGETCEGSSDVGDCQGAMFLVVEDGNAHLVQITNIDTTNDEINFEDLSYGTSDENEEYTDGAETTFDLKDAEEITIVLDESAMTITFTTIGSSDGATITTNNGATLEIVNTDTTNQYFEGLLFSERDDGDVDTYLTDFEITAAYDDVTDNSIEFGLDSVSALGTSEGFGLFDFSDTNDDDQVFMTYKGSLITYDRENQQSLVIEHPEGTVYAVVSME